MTDTSPTPETTARAEADRIESAPPVSDPEIDVAETPAVVHDHADDFDPGSPAADAPAVF